MHKIFDNVDLVIFDVMGVILSEGDLIRGGLQPRYKERFTYEQVKGFYQKIRKNTTGDGSLWKDLGIKDVETERMEYLDSFDIDPNFFEFRDLLIDKDFELSILSNMPKEWGEYLNSKLELDKDFYPMVFSGDVGYRKPDAEMYEYFLSKTDIDPSRMVFIDDRLKNLAKASEYGIKTILFERREDDNQYVPDLKIKSFEELY